MINDSQGIAKSVSVIVPARNEEKNIVQVLRKPPSYVDEVILVDGNSTDNTIAVSREVVPNIVVIGQGRKGKGNALAAGFEAATCDLIVMIDADGSMDPGEIDAYLEPLLNGADYVKGSRFMRGGGSDDITPIRRAGNWFLNTLTNILFRSRYTDLCYGYNAFTRECVEVFDLPPSSHLRRPQRGDGFEIETMINVRVAKAGLTIAEVPSHEYLRISGVSNLNTFRDGFRVLWTIFQEAIIPTPTVHLKRAADKPARNEQSKAAA